MSSSAWELLTTALSPADSPWELFHENSKGSRDEPPMNDAVAAAYLHQMPESLAYDGYPAVPLPDAPALPAVPVSELLARPAAAALDPAPLPLGDAAALLRYAYGVLDRTAESARGPRTVYSAGSLYPLELFACVTRVEGLGPGLCHYDASGHLLHVLRGGDHSQKLAPAIGDGRLAQMAPLLIFVAALPERSVLKYGDRGYRFALLEAGAVVQNIQLVAGALGLAVVHVGDYFDRMIDDLFAFDGLTLSVINIIGIGKPPGLSEDESHRSSTRRH
jgi:SagB-type dehydrogenase family enzyme